MFKLAEKLVGAQNWFDPPNRNPNWRTYIFQRGRYTTNQFPICGPKTHPEDFVLKQAWWHMVTTGDPPAGHYHGPLAGQRGQPTGNLAGSMSKKIVSLSQTHTHMIHGAGIFYRHDWVIFRANVGKYAIHGSFAICIMYKRYNCITHY